MTDKEKAKAYDEAISWIKEQMAFGRFNDEQKDMFKGRFPELAESEDERIMKELLVDIPKVFPYDKAFRYIALLEKQKEQKQENQNEQHKQTADEAKKYNDAYEKGYKLGYENGCLEQKPAEWSEEDEKHIQKAIECVYMHGFLSTVDFLRRIRPGWKPSEVQLDSLYTAKNIMRKNQYEGFADDLDDLYDDLKKL